MGNLLLSQRITLEPASDRSSGGFRVSIVPSPMEIVHIPGTLRLGQKKIISEQSMLLVEWLSGCLLSGNSQ